MQLGKEWEVAHVDYVGGFIEGVDLEVCGCEAHKGSNNGDGETHD